jgi:predicted GIY-YIG superfamily endonuclease
MATLGGLGGVYMFVNTLNGKSYVGSTINLVRRFNEHYCGSYSNTALKSTGHINFSFIILANKALILAPLRGAALRAATLAHLSGIYMILNQVNGKYYIGSSTIGDRTRSNNTQAVAVELQDLQGNTVATF